jgi:hypothetical protein
LHIGFEKARGTTGNAKPFTRLAICVPLFVITSHDPEALHLIEDPPHLSSGTNTTLPVEAVAH